MNWSIIRVCHQVNFRKHGVGVGAFVCACLSTRPFTAACFQWTFTGPIHNRSQLISFSQLPCCTSISLRHACIALIRPLPATLAPCNSDADSNHPRDSCYLRILRITVLEQWSFHSSKRGCDYLYVPNFAIIVYQHLIISLNILKRMKDRMVRTQPFSSATNTFSIKRTSPDSYDEQSQSTT